MLALFWRPQVACMPLWADVDTPTTVWSDAEDPPAFCVIPVPPPLPVAPSNVFPPSISGLPIVGEVLTRDVGVWTGTEPITFTTQWLRDGIDIGGATAPTYSPTAADIGTMISVRVTATNAAASVSATSTAVGPVVSGVGSDFTTEFSSEFI
jgi:hypothetical protein